MSDDRWINKIHQGDVMEILKQMPSEFVDMVITSPPYWGLRDYGVDGQIRWGNSSSDDKMVKHTISNNQWIHTVLTLDESGAIKLYINGILRSTNNLPAGEKMQSNTRTVRIGHASADSHDRYFNGTIDEVRIYNRALSASEIAEHYRTESARFKIKPR